MEIKTYSLKEIFSKGILKLNEYDHLPTWINIKELIDKEV